MKNKHKPNQLHRLVRHSDFAGVARAFQQGADANQADSRGYTPLMYAVSNANTNPELIQLLIDHDADVNAEVPSRQVTVLTLALKVKNLEVIKRLVTAGADLHYESKSGYNALINAMHGEDIARDKNLVPLVRYLIEQAVYLNAQSDYCESGLSVASYYGRFDVVKILLDAGANPKPLQWTELMMALVFGELSEVERLAKTDADLMARDFWERTPWLLSIQLGNIPKTGLLLNLGSNRDDQGRRGKTPLMYAVENHHIPMIRWLAEQGFDLDQVDQTQSTALMLAAEKGYTDCVKCLLDLGADLNLRDHIDHKPVQKAANREIVQLFIEHGDDLNELDGEMRRELLGYHNDELEVDEPEYVAGKHRRNGNSNPECMNVPFWRAMVRAGVGAWQARDQFGDTYNQDEPVWCFDRFGKSITALPDGRYIEIAGEHEDFYDPDFCIYNDVIVHYGNGEFDIYGYPQAIFPPTDFHSATMVGDWIYIIGSLGYNENIQYGYTPVYRLNIGTYAIEKLDTHGESPGWISEHKGVLLDQATIKISGGKICVLNNQGEADYIDNLEIYRLDLNNLQWCREK